MAAQCQYALRFRSHPYLVCARLCRPGKDYARVQDAVSAFCLHQRHCRYTGRQENTPAFRQCDVRLRDVSEREELPHGQTGETAEHPHRGTD